VDYDGTIVAGIAEIDRSATAADCTKYALILLETMNGRASLGGDLIDLARLLRKYGHDWQATVAEEISDTIRTPTPDYRRLAGVDMWGGSGAVWEISLTSSSHSTEARQDQKLFNQTIIRIASAMDLIGIGTERSRSTARILQESLNQKQS